MAGHIYIKNEDGSIYTNSKETYRCVEGSVFVWHGEWSDPEVIWDGESINVNDIEDSLYYEYKEWCEENDTEYTDEGLEEYIKNQGTEHIVSIMNEIIFLKEITKLEDIKMSKEVFYDSANGTLCLPKNDYVAPTEVRSQVVAWICEAMLAGWPIQAVDKANRMDFVDYYVTKEKVCGSRRFRSGYGYDGYGAAGIFQNGDIEKEHAKMRNCEIQRAFDELRKAGWFVYKIYNCGNTFYKVSKKSNLQNTNSTTYELTTKFTEDFD